MREKAIVMASIDLYTDEVERRNKEQEMAMSARRRG